jgi:DNA-binding NarL/FixJ family response regulator
MAYGNEPINGALASSTSITSEDVEDGNVNDGVVGKQNPYETVVVLIEKRTLLRECLARNISTGLSCAVVSFDNIGSWQASVDIRASLIIFSGEGYDRDHIRQLSETGSGHFIVILSDAPDFDNITESITCGVRGYIPTNTSLNVTIAALRIVLAGGVFVPADCFLNTRSAPNAWPSGGQEIRGFSPRENAVANAIGKGKTNKIIAFELGISESTVKVHVYNIMKKMHVKNRTEAAINIRAQTNVTAALISNSNVETGTAVA